MVSALISRVVILVFGTLYPAYSSYKAVKNKDVKEYVKWMMYWIVFALFTTVETFADVLVSWFPFYYELKIIFVIWLLSPATKGSSVLYRKFVHPELLKREEEIDLTLDKVKSQGYTALVNVGQQGLNYAVQSAMTGQTRVMDHIMKKSLSLGDLSRQQPDATLVTYKPSTERIVEDRDEPDISRHAEHLPPSMAPMRPEVENVEFQGGVRQGGDATDNTRQRGYNLRSQEYHGEDTSAPTTQHYNHQENPEGAVNENVAPVPQPVPELAVGDNVKVVGDNDKVTRRPKTASSSRSRSRTRSAGRKSKLPKSQVTTKNKTDRKKS